MAVAVALLALFVFGALVAVVDRRRHPDRWLRRRIAAGAVLLLFTPIVLLYGRWTLMTVRCGRQPVAVSNFAAAYSYRLPSDPGYRRDSIFQNYVCSEAEAVRKGYERGGR